MIKRIKTGAGLSSRNQKLVLSVVIASPVPLSAYAILKALQEEGVRHPLPVYRALDKLVVLGLVHRLHTISAYIAAAPTDGAHVSDEPIVFAICDVCGHVTGLKAPSLTQQLSRLAHQIGFTIQQPNFEIHGRCTECSAVASTGSAKPRGQTIPVEQDSEIPLPSVDDLPIAVDDTWHLASQEPDLEPTQLAEPPPLA